MFEVKQMARDLYMAHSFGVVPTNLDAILAANGVEIQRVKFLGAGIVSRSNRSANKMLIEVAEGASLEFSRFAIAHGLLHLLRHGLDCYEETENSLSLRNEMNGRADLEANAFAIELLMPEMVFKVTILQRTKSKEQVREKFGVSAQAFSLRRKQIMGLPY